MEEYNNAIEFDNKINDMYNVLAQELTADIIKLLSETKTFNSFTKSQFDTLVSINGQKLLEESILKLNSISDERKKELTKLFEAMYKKNIKDYNDVTDDLKLSDEQYEILLNGILMTDEDFANFSATVANATNKAYVDIMNSAYIKVASGGLDFNTVFKDSINYLAMNGIQISHKSIEASVRQALKYSLRQNMRMIDSVIDKELGTDGVQINISPNCRPDHQVINGKIFSNEEWVKYKHLLDDYGCQHYETGVFVDISTNRYTQKKIDEANNRTVEYDGKDIPYYEATQMQRALERAVRKAKTYLYTLEKSNASEGEKAIAKNIIKKKQAQIRDYTNITGLLRDYDRERVAK